MMYQYNSSKLQKTIAMLVPLFYKCLEFGMLRTGAVGAILKIKYTMIVVVQQNVKQVKGALIKDCSGEVVRYGTFGCLWFVSLLC